MRTVTVREKWEDKKVKHTDEPCGILSTWEFMGGAMKLAKRKDGSKRTDVVSVKKGGLKRKLDGNGGERTQGAFTREGGSMARRRKECPPEWQVWTHSPFYSTSLKSL